ncbi:sigma factor-like helix-turn-helix DNA-binding protein [Nonomuraea angiospora]
MLRYYEDLPESEVAKIMRCSVGTVRSQTHQAVARLRELVGENVTLEA